MEGPDTLLVSPAEAAKVLRVGRSTIYDLMRTNALTSVKIGRSRRIPMARLREYVDQLQPSRPGESR